MSTSKIQKIEVSMNKGKYRTALKEIEKNLKESDMEKSHQIDILLLKCKSLNILGQYKEVIKFSQELQKLAVKYDCNLVVIDALLEEIFANYRLNNLEIAIDLIRKVEELVQKCQLEGIEERESYLLWNSVLVHSGRGNIEQALILAQENYNISQEIDYKLHEARANYALGWVYSESGEMKKALRSLDKSLALMQKINNLHGIAYVAFRLGYVQKSVGELDKAHEYFIQSLDIREKIGNYQDIIWTELNIGDVLYAKNDLKNAQDYYEKSLYSSQQNNYYLGIVISLLRLSTIYENLDDPQLVIDTLEKTLDYAQNIETVEAEVYALFGKINFIIKKNIQSKDLDKLLKRLKEISIHYKNKRYTQVYNLAEALILRAKGNSKHKQKIITTLKEITEEEVIDFDITKIAMLNYSELLAESLKKYLGEDLLVTELSELSDSLSLEQYQYSYSMVAQSILIQTQSALDRVDISSARDLLSRAQYLHDFLVLYNKGTTPFRILYSLFVKERCLNELSSLLSVTKGALNSHLKLLIDLDLVQVSREEQVRSDRMLKKFYTLGSKSKDLLQPFKINILSSLEANDEEYSSLIALAMIPRIMTKILRDTVLLIENYQVFLEEQYLMRSKNNKSEERFINRIKERFNPGDSIKINHYFLSDEQNEKYLQLWKEFEKKIETEVYKKKDSSKMHNIEKKNYVAHISLPIQDLIYIDSLRDKNRKKRSRQQKTRKD